MADVLLTAGDKDAHIEIAVAVTTEVCRAAYDAHGLSTTSTIGLGRLLTAAGLMAATSKRPGITSIQILASGRLRQLYADATEEGHLRGYSRNPSLTHPPVPSKDEVGRQSIAAVVLPGRVSVVRSNEKGEYGQSAVPLASGEIDLDVEAFLRESDQIDTVLACETLIAPDGTVTVAGGVIAQAMPDAAPGALDEIRAKVAGGALAKLMYEHSSAEALLKAIAPSAELVDTPSNVEWRCRCSRERVLSAIGLVSPEELAEMVDKEEGAEVTCDFCSTKYQLTHDEVLEIFVKSIKARG